MKLPQSAPSSPPWTGYAAATAGVALTTVFIHVVPGADHVANISLLYLLSVIFTAYTFGRGAAVAAALLAVSSFDWFFVEPRYNLLAEKPAEWIMLAMFLLTAVVISQLTQNLRLSAEEASLRERETAALAQASWAVASQLSYQDTLVEVLAQMAEVIPTELAVIVVPGEENSLDTLATYAAPGVSVPDFSTGEERAVMEWLTGHPGAIPCSIAPFAQPLGAIFMTLAVEKQVLGVLYLRRKESRPVTAQERRVMEALAHHASVALARHRQMQAQADAEVLAQTDKLKTALLSMVSHDFRSPLAAIKASVTGLLQEGLPWDATSQKELLSGIDHETDRLNRMVGDILTLSQLEADAWKPMREPVSIAEIVGATLDVFSNEENGRIQVSVERGLPEVSLDSVQIVQVLKNLLENALKYSPPHTIAEITAARFGDQLSIKVLDRGFGLPAGEEKQIFERFYRGHQWRESSVPGSGIGLAICRGLVEAHGGNLDAYNRQGGGSVFRVLLPLEATSAAP